MVRMGIDSRDFDGSIGSGSRLRGAREQILAKATQRFRQRLFCCGKAQAHVPFARCAEAGAWSEGDAGVAEEIGGKSLRVGQSIDPRKRVERALWFGKRHAWDARQRLDDLRAASRIV